MELFLASQRHVLAQAFDVDEARLADPFELQNGRNLSRGRVKSGRISTHSGQHLVEDGADTSHLLHMLQLVGQQ